jgi:uncharacterized repeat protein (TIGR01451 family)
MTETVRKPFVHEPEPRGEARLPHKRENRNTQKRRHIMQYQKKVFLSILAAAILLPAIAWAAPQVELSIDAEKEVTVVEDSHQVTKRVPASEAAPGEAVIFTIHYENTGDEAATNVVINNPLPEGTAYVPGSATEKGEVTFSIDKGETFKKPSLLTYEVTTPQGNKEKRTASPERYTNVRWQLPEVAAGSSGEVHYRVRVK